MDIKKNLDLLCFTFFFCDQLTYRLVTAHPVVVHNSYQEAHTLKKMNPACTLNPFLPDCKTTFSRIYYIFLCYFFNF